MTRVSAEKTAQLLSVMDESFRFKIGDEVHFKHVARDVRVEREINGEVEAGSARYLQPRLGVPPGFTVIERFLQECHGGVQLQYKLRSFDKDGSTSGLTAFDFELSPWQEASDALKAMVKKKEEKGISGG